MRDINLRFCRGDAVVPIPGEFPYGVAAIRIEHVTDWFGEGVGLGYDELRPMPDDSFLNIETNSPQTVTKIKVLYGPLLEYLQWQDDGGHCGA